MLNFAKAESKILATIVYEAEQFVEGYIAGSCNSYDECIEVFKNYLEETFGVKLTSEESDTLLNEKIEAAGIFLCEDCGWWCWEHEASYRSISCCTECSPNEEEDE